MLSIEYMKKLFRELFTEEIWNKGNINLVDECFNPNFILHIDTSDVYDREETKKFITRYKSAFPLSRLSITNIMVENEMLAMRGQLVYNSEMSAIIFIHAKFLDTKILEMWVMDDDITLKRQFDSVKEYTLELEKLNTEIESTQREIIFTMGEIVETRSKETGFHVKRVAEYSKLIAIKLGLTEEEAEILRLASPMHDVGKVGIPDSILNKPGKLTDEEFNVIKTHTTIGYEMLKQSNRTLMRAAAIVAHQHHEKYNGSGYPNSLKKEEIHYYGRITAIADVFDALSSDRVYKKAWPLNEILELYKKERGQHFDPILVDIFFENIDEILRIKQLYRDEKRF